MGIRSHLSKRRQRRTQRVDIEACMEAAISAFRESLAASTEHARAFHEDVAKDLFTKAKRKKEQLP